MGKIKGRIVSEFEYNTESGDMVCRNNVFADSDKLPIEIALRAYVSLGANLNEVNQLSRYGIRSEEDHRRVVEEITAELDREL